MANLPLTDADLVSIQEVRAKVELAYQAFQQLRTFSQAQLDAIVEAVAAAGRADARRLAQLAVDETGYGNAADKFAKNMLAAELLPKAIRGMKTIGILAEHPDRGLTEIGVPVGVVAAILPTTNPTSTAIYKTLIALKAGNTVVLSPHPRARRCTCETAALLARAAEQAGAPAGSVQCIGTATMEGTSALMQHRRTAVILATGGAGIVKAAYSSGKPAYGVGPGNVPVLLDDSFDAGDCVRHVLAGKSFDYGTLCSSEQTLVATAARKQAVLEALASQGAYLCSAEQGQALARVLITDRWTIAADCVGQPAAKVARLAGFEVPGSTRVLAVEIGGIGKQHPLSMEKLSPVLSLLFVASWEEQVRACQAILKFGGLGHTCGLYSNDPARTTEYGLRMPAFRVVVNTPTPLGSTGITSGAFPALTLGCGAMAGNATSDNVSPLHLVNIKRIARVLRPLEEVMNPLKAAEASTPPVPEVAQAVERFLSTRGLAPAGKAPGSTVTTTATTTAAATSTTAAAVVDRFLQNRSLRPASAVAAAAPSCGCGVPTERAPLVEADVAEAPLPPAGPAPMEFVAEADVRLALHSSRKLTISSKTIVTPAASDLASQFDIFTVVAPPPTTSSVKGSE
jgi:acetaldehyde dehydrogenase (acetylating)